MKTISAHELHERSDVQILDVREPGEWDAGHIAGAQHIPMGELGTRLDEVATDRPVVAVCRSGQRSGQVTLALASHGYDVANLDGGLQAWERLGLPLTSAQGTPGRVA